MEFFRKYPLILLFLIGMLPLLALLMPGLPLTHDGQDHVARIANFYASLAEGNLVPRWAANLNWGYGHPVIMFLYPFSSYLASLFHLVGFSFVDSTKLVFAGAFIAGILAMFIWLREETENKTTAFIGSLLYGFAPYRFVDLYVRGAIGEHMAFVWPPVICYFLLKISNIKYQISNRSIRQAQGRQIKNQIFFTWIGAGASLAGLILSHNAIAVLFLPLIILYAFYLFIYKTSNKSLFLIHNSLFIILGFSLSAFYWFPAFFEGKYTLRDIVTAGEAVTRFVSFSRFFLSPWNYGGGNEFSKEIGLLHWTGIMMVILAFPDKKNQSKKVFIAVMMVLFMASLVMMTSLSTVIWNNIGLLQKFQFPWRILSVTVFISSVLAAIGFTKFQQFIRSKFVIHNSLFVFLFTILITGSTYHMWKPKAYLIKPESFYTGIYDSTTDTGESSPIRSTRFMEKRPSTPLAVDQGEVRIKPLSRTTTTRIYEVEAEQSTRLIENTLYFPGWNIFIDNTKTDIQFQDPKYRGLMTFRVEAGIHDVRIIFSETKLRKVADLISILSLISVIIYIPSVWIWTKKLQK